MMAKYQLVIKAPKDVDCSAKTWPAQYAVLGEGDARLVRIEARSAIDVVVAKIAEEGFLGPQTYYYIASPNYGVAIPGIPSLLEDHWIMEKLLQGMSAPDAVTVAQVLRDLGDF